MKAITIVVPFFRHPGYEDMLRRFAASDLVEKIIVNGKDADVSNIEKCETVELGTLTSQRHLWRILNLIASDYLLIVAAERVIEFEFKGLEEMLNSATVSTAGMIYCDYFDAMGGTRVAHVLNDYQPGSVRDDFEFGPLILFSLHGIREATRRHGIIPDVQFAAIYDLRLKISIDFPVKHIKRILYTAAAIGQERSEASQFAYVDPRQSVVQKEMESVFTDYLKKIGAYLCDRDISDPPSIQDRFPVEASVIIPVKNRKHTIADAVESAYSQKTDFPFNVIVVDNYSTDGTTAALEGLANYENLRHLIPERKDLGIGGCWNEAVRSDYCGRYAIQLDSDDLYAGPASLQRIVDAFRRANYAIVIGSYTIVDFDLKEIPPGLIDHREWTDENGRNNALRVNGMGAPRAYRTDLLRKMPFLNVSYGEDYAAVLRFCREYRVGRIYESLYLCRRWPGNTDAALSLEARNANDSFKDCIRTEEILARRELNRKRGTC
ncbi:MAG TPA: glycosyltransferase family 2 protein [Syntrophorhabdaceae bacterium]|nr:glycosyltransferase family 2 protein [Syntrophorhabdaceae bacterium]